VTLIALFVYIVIVVVLGYVAVWVMGQIAPGHPAVIDRIIWVVVVLIVVLVVANAVGLTGGPMVPRFR
jgi:hypothetical protein